MPNHSVNHIQHFQQPFSDNQLFYVYLEEVFFSRSRACSISDLDMSFNQPKLCPNASWNPNAITFENDTTSYISYNVLFVNTNNTVFMTRHDTGQILIRRDGNSTPTTITPASVSMPHSLFVAAGNQIFVSNSGHDNRVDRWASNHTQLPSLMIAGSGCDALFVDTNSNLYCSQFSQHRVVRNPLDSSMNMSVNIVAGTGSPGSSANMLSGPLGIFVTIDLDLYVADSGNNRVQLFHSGELNAITVAGNGASGALSLSTPTGVVLDADGYLFIVDRGNHRIVGSGLGGSRCVVGCSGVSGSTSSQLSNPSALSFDTHGNMFVADWNNHRTQKFLLSNNSCGKWENRTVSQVYTRFSFSSCERWRKCIQWSIGMHSELQDKNRSPILNWIGAQVEQYDPYRIDYDEILPINGFRLVR